MIGQDKIRIERCFIQEWGEADDKRNFLEGLDECVPLGMREKGICMKKKECVYGLRATCQDVFREILDRIRGQKVFALACAIDSWLRVAEPNHLLLLCSGPCR